MRKTFSSRNVLLIERSAARLQPLCSVGLCFFFWGSRLHSWLQITIPKTGCSWNQIQDSSKKRTSFAFLVVVTQAKLKIRSWAGKAKVTWKSATSISLLCELSKHPAPNSKLSIRFERRRATWHFSIRYFNEEVMSSRISDTSAGSHSDLTFLQCKEKKLRFSSILVLGLRASILSAFSFLLVLK